jgi:uncharacterized protein (DUF1501 family)
LVPNYDFRGFYATIVEKWLGLDSVPFVGGNFEQLDFVQMPYEGKVGFTS